MTEPELKKFKPVGEYDWPPVPTEEAIKRWWRKAELAIGTDGDEPFVEEEKLKRTTQDKLENVAPPPACGPLQEELEYTLKDWLADDAPSHWIKVVILPPCDEFGVVENWASDGKRKIVDPPDRSELTSLEKDVSVNLKPGKSGILVIPKLERWFIRHRNGLRHIRALLKELDGLERHCVIGCNSWAWAFIEKAVGADRILPSGIVFQAFDEPRLRAWLHSLAKNSDGKDVVFRLSSTGQDVFEIEDDPDDEEDTKSDHINRLAAQSYGIPWVAWRMWRRSLRDAPEKAERSEELREISDDNVQTFWISEDDTFVLPDTHKEMTLLILQALLIHGSMTMEELALVLPTADHMSIVAALSASGFVNREDGEMRVLPAAYPAVRRALDNAGVPTDRL